MKPPVNNKLYLIFSEHAGHAREIAENVKGVNEFECILCCSGDGIINEVKAEFGNNSVFSVREIKC